MTRFFQGHTEVNMFPDRGCPICPKLHRVCRLDFFFLKKKESFFFLYELHEIN